MRRTGGSRAVTALAATYSLAVFLALIVHGPRPLRWIEQFSYRNADPGLLFDGVQTEPLLGVHHFADWQEVVSWARFENPYLTPAVGTHVLPPAVHLLRLVEGLPLLVSYGFVVLVTTSMTFATTWMLLPDHPRRMRALLWFLVFGISSGFMSSIDRGSLQGLALAFVGLWVVGLRRDQPRVAT